MLLSAAIIVRDEAEHLDACLRSLDGLVDEIVVVDTGSTDDSIEVARRHGAVLGHEPWQGDFATPRNRSLDLATGDWILYIDADERVHDGDHALVRELLARANAFVSFRVRFVPRVDWTPYREFRLWRHRPDIRFEHAIHETMLDAIGRVARAEGLLIGDLDALTIEHFGYEGDQTRKHARNAPMLRASLERDPDRPFLYDHLARIHEALGEHEEARASWRSGMAVARARDFEHPDDRLLWTNLLLHSVLHDDPDGDVAAVADEAYARFGTNPAIEFALALRELELGDAAQAGARIEQLLRLDLDAIVETNTAYDRRLFGEWAWNALGLARFELGDFDGAAAMFRLAETADPENVAYRTRRQLADARAAK